MKKFFSKLFGQTPGAPAASEALVPEPLPKPMPEHEAPIGATRRVMPIQGPDAPKIPSQCVNTLKFVGVQGAGPWMFMSPEPEHACAYAKERIGTLLGSEDGIALPPKLCNKVACLCFYQRQTESRSKLRRAADRPGERVEAQKKPPPELERRKNRGRRRSDQR
jgi:hypothetical protein